MNLIDFLNINYCFIDFYEDKKKTVIKKISEIVSEKLKIENNSIYEKIIEREEKGTTGFGKNIAIPHIRLDKIDDFIIFVFISKKGMDFNSIDKKKVNIIILILGPEREINKHLKVLAAISRLLSNEELKKELINSKTPLSVYETIIRYSGFEEKLKSEKKKIMYLILSEDKFFYDILEFLIEKGVDGATVVDSTEMGQYISNIPLFASFFSFTEENKYQSKLIISMIPDNEVNKIVKGIESITGDLNKMQGVMIIIQDVFYYKGSMKIY